MTTQTSGSVASRGFRGGRVMLTTLAVLTALASLTTTVLLATPQHGEAQPIAASSATPRGTPGKAKRQIDPADFDEIRRLRGRLGLDNASLATAGFAESDAFRALEATYAWQQANADRVRSSRRAIYTAQAALRAARREMARGSNGVSLERRLASAQSGVDAARQAEQTLLAELDRSVAAQLAGSAAQGYDLARRAAGFTGDGRRPSSSVAELDRLRRFARAREAAEARPAVGGLAAAVSAESLRFSSTRAAGLPGVLRAEAQVLPTPAEPEPFTPATPGTFLRP